MITDSKVNDHETKKKYEMYKTFTSILESVDTVVTDGATTTSVN